MRQVTIDDVRGKQDNHNQVDYFLDGFKKLLIPAREYLKKNETAPKWVIYIEGHGASTSTVCSLSISVFKDFLAFLRNVPMKLLIYLSCYASGKTEEILYKDDGTYDFPIIARGLNDSIVNPLTTFSLFHLYANLDQSGPSYYNGFINSLSLSARGDTVKNTAQIRYPGLAWFSVLDHSTLVSLGKLMAKTRTKPLVINTFFASSKKISGILLYTNVIPFEIIINFTSLSPMPNKEELHFVSMVPGETLHRLKKISSDDISYNDLLRSFFIRGISESATKTFLIDELTAPKLPTDKNLITLKQIVIRLEKDVMFVGYLNADDHPRIAHYAEVRVTSSVKISADLPLTQVYAVNNDWKEWYQKESLYFSQNIATWNSDDFKKVRESTGKKIQRGSILPPLIKSVPNKEATSIIVPVINPTTTEPRAENLKRVASAQTVRQKPVQQPTTKIVRRSVRKLPNKQKGSPRKASAR